MQAKQRKKTKPKDSKTQNSHDASIEYDEDGARD